MQMLFHKYLAISPLKHKKSLQKISEGFCGEYRILKSLYCRTQTLFLIL